MGETDSPERRERPKAGVKIKLTTEDCRKCAEKFGFDPRPELCWECLISARKPEELSENDYPLSSPDRKNLDVISP